MIKKIGIYKIESPSKKIYIGQSKNIEERFKQYYRLTSIKNQRRLYKSLLKYGVINHKFKIIEECNIEELNIKERYWQEYYDVIGPNGLNCKYVEVSNKPYIISNETREILSNKSANAKEVICLKTKRIWSSVKKCAEDNGIEHKKLCNLLNGININNTFLLYLEDTPMNGINYNCELIASNDKKVINVKTGKIYDSLVKCCLDNNLRPKTLGLKLNNKRKNNTDFLYLNREVYLYYKYCKLLEKVLSENLYTPFSIHDSEYIEELNKRLDNLKIKIEMDSKKDYDKEPVFACKHCGTLVVPNQYEVDDDGNEICMRCGSVNEAIEYKNIFEYNKEQKIKPIY